MQNSIFIISLFLIAEILIIILFLVSINYVQKLLEIFKNIEQSLNRITNITNDIYIDGVFIRSERAATTKNRQSIQHNMLLHNSFYDDRVLNNKIQEEILQHGKRENPLNP